MHWTVEVRPVPDFGNEQAAVAVGNEVYLFGGRFGKSLVINVHVFNTVSLRWRTLPPAATRMGEPPLDVPCVRECHTAALVEDSVYILGGCDDILIDLYCNALYAFDVDAHTWFKPRVSGTGPEGRMGHSACVLKKVMFIFGGHTQLTGETNDMYKLDTTTMVWSLINTRGTAPPPSCCHSATTIGTKIFVFGGVYDGAYGEDEDYEDIRVFDTETDLWKKTRSAPISRRASPSAFTRNGELYIFGGYNARDWMMNDLWKLSPETFSWKEVKPKGNGPPMSGKYDCCCMVGDRIILFGGDYSCDLYVLDLNPSLKTLCKLVFIQYSLDPSGLPHGIRWELRAMNGTTK